MKGLEKIFREKLIVDREEKRGLHLYIATIHRASASPFAPC